MTASHNNLPFHGGTGIGGSVFTLRHIHEAMMGYRRRQEEHYARILQRAYRRHILRRHIERRIVKKRLLAVMNSAESKEKIYAPHRLRYFLNNDAKRKWKISIE